MAFPIPRSVTVTSDNTAGTSHAVNLPATIRAGDTIFVAVRCPVAGAVGWPTADWNELADGSPDASVGQVACAWKKADGSESGTTITVTTGSGKLAGLAYAIQGATDPLIRAPEINTPATGTSAGEPNAGAITPTGGAKDYLWLTFFGMEGEQTGITAYPTNYTLGQSGLANTGTGGAVTTNATMAGAARQANAASEDAGIWDVTGTLDDWTAYTVAFHPAEPIPAPLQTDTEDVDQSNRSLFAKVAPTLFALVMPSALALLVTPPPSEPVYVTKQVTLIQARAHARVADPPNLLLSTLAPPSAQPFGQTEWPLPLPRDVQAYGYTWSFGPLQQPVAPVAQTEWPLPPLRPALRDLTWTQTRSLGLVDEANHSPTDWPLPSPPLPRAVDLLTWTQARPFFYAEPGTPPPHLTEWPLPLSIPRPDTLTHVQPRPFFYTEPVVAELPVGRDAGWPVPARRQTLLIQIATRPSEEAVVEGPRPFAQQDWPTPQPLLALRQVLTHTQARPAFYTEPAAPPPSRGLPSELPPSARPDLITLRSQIAYYVVDMSAPFVQGDWPLPAPVPRRDVTLQTWTQNLLESTLFVAAPTPHRPIDWPVPTGRAYPHELRTHTQERPFFSVDQANFSPDDWPNPQPIRALRVTELTHVQERPFFYAEPGTPPPGRMLDQPNPRGKDYPIALRTHLQARPIHAVDQDNFSPSDWPIPPQPKPRVLDLLTWTQERPFFYAEPGALPPGRMLDQPNPRGKDYPIALRTAINTRQPFHVDRTPAALRDWPNPRGKAYPHDLRTWTQTPAVPVILPFRATEWPNPQGKVYPITLRTVINVRPFFYTDPRNFSPYDWPLPQPQPRLAAMESVALGRITSLPLTADVGHTPIIVGTDTLITPTVGLGVFPAIGGGIDTLGAPTSGLDVYATPAGGIDTLPSVTAGADALPSVAAGVGTLVMVSAGLSEDLR